MLQELNIAGFMHTKISNTCKRFIQKWDKIKLTIYQVTTPNVRFTSVTTGVILRESMSVKLLSAEIILVRRANVAAVSSDSS
jgi:hypothetical protein